jgi:hypothetical protein
MGWLKKVYSFYIEGFKEMTWGKTVWLVILLKLFIFFFIMKLFFFPDMLKERYKTDQERSQHILETITNSK